MGQARAGPPGHICEANLLHSHYMALPLGALGCIRKLSLSSGRADSSIEALPLPCPALALPLPCPCPCPCPCLCPCPCPWLALGLPLACPWLALGLPLACPWLALGLPWACPWLALGLPWACPGLALGLPLSRGCPAVALSSLAEAWCLAGDQLLFQMHVGRDGISTHRHTDTQTHRHTDTHPHPPLPLACPWLALGLPWACPGLAMGLPWACPCPAVAPRLPCPAWLLFQIHVGRDGISTHHLGLS